MSCTAWRQAFLSSLSAITFRHPAHVPDIRLKRHGNKLWRTKIFLRYINGLRLIPLLSRRNEARYEHDMAIRYSTPDRWIRCDPVAVVGELTEAKASILFLANIPLQRSWAEDLQEMELKREVAGTSRIEGADFTEREFEEAVADDAPDEHFQPIAAASPSGHQHIPMDRRAHA